MTLPRLHIRTLMVAVPLAGVVLAIEAAAWVGPFGDGFVLVWLLSIAWVPAVSLLLDPKLVGWLCMLVVSLLALSLGLAAHGGLGQESGIGAIVANLWLAFAFGIGSVATKAVRRE